MHNDVSNRPVSTEPHAPVHPEQAAAGGASLPWPPPLLEPLLGAAWQIARRSAAGSILLFAPLLFGLGGGSAPAGAPPFLAEALLVIGLLVLALAASNAWRSLAAARTALAAGHGRLTVLEAAADRRGDTGLLLAGEHEYAALPREARTLLRLNRVAAAVLALLAGVLPVAGFLTVTLLAYAGVVDASGAWLLVFAPLVIAGVLAAAALVLESALLSSPRRTWAKNAAATLAPDVAAWAGRFDATREGGPGRGRTGGAIALRLIAAGTVLGMLAVAAYASLLGIAVLRARSLESVMPRVGSTAARIANVEAARPYRLAVDPAISAEAAGHALHALVMAGIEDPDPLFRRPVRAYEEGWTRPAGPVPFSPPVPGADWIRAAAEGLTPEQTTYLRDFTSHPALAELPTIARAGAIDIASTRYVSPLPDSVTQWTLPWVRPMAMRQAAEAMVARAALALHAGRAGEAETMLREVVSFGVLVADDSPFLVDALVGASIAVIGQTALEALFDVTGRDDEAAHAARLASAVRRAAAAGGGSGQKPAVEPSPGALALDPTAPRALRWEMAGAHVVMSECGSLRHRFFGESAEYREWKEQARSALVGTPSEAALFDIMLATPARAELPPRSMPERIAAFAARLLPGGPACSAIWAVL